MGQEHYCENMYTTGGDGPDDVRPGSFAEYTVTGANSLYAKPPAISFDAGCQTEPLSGAWKGIINYSELKVGDDVVIIGTGGIGMYCLMAWRRRVRTADRSGRHSDHALETLAIGGNPHSEPKPTTLSPMYEILPAVATAAATRGLRSEPKRPRGRDDLRLLAPPRSPPSARPHDADLTAAGSTTAPNRRSRAAY